MRFRLILCYSDVFPGKSVPGDAISILKEQPTKNLLAFFCFINGNLHWDAFSQREHALMVNMLLARQSLELKANVKVALDRQAEITGDLNVFDIRSNLRNICFLLKECDLVDTEARITPEERKAVLMATLVTNEEYNRTANNPAPTQPQSTDLETFCEYMWPNMVKSAGHRMRGNIFIHSYKSVAFMRFLEQNAAMAKHFKEYFGMPADTDLIRFSNNLLNVYIQLGMNRGSDRINYGMGFKLDENPALARFTLDVSNYSKNDFNSLDFKTLRSYPILKLNTELFVVTNWNFVLDKMNSAVIFDLFNNTNLKNEYLDKKGNPSFNTFKAELGYNYAENLFQKVAIETIVKPGDIYTIGKPDAEDNQDFYLRRKNKVALFEHKDILMIKDGNYATNYDHYQKIKDQIDKNLSGDKGIGQLKKHLDKLANDFKVFEKAFPGKVNPRSAVIYPVLVVTEPLYTIPGIGLYLNIELKKMIAGNDYPFYVKPLVLLDFDYFVEHYDSLRCGKQDFFKTMEKYYSRVLKYKLMKNVTVSTNEYMQKFNSFREHIESDMKFPNHYKNMRKPGTFANMTVRSLMLRKM